MDEILRHVISTLRGMWKFRWLGVASAWLAGVALFVGVSLFPERYEATARVFANTESILKPLMTGLTVQPNDEQRIGMLSRMVISRPNVESIVAAVGLAGRNETAQQLDARIDSVMKRLQFRAAGRDNLYTLSFRDTDPERARRTVEMLAGMFIESSKGSKTQDTETAKRFIEEQIGIYEKKLQEAEERLKEFRTRYLGMAPGEGRSDYFARMAETERVLNQARLELREAERSRDALRRGLAAAETPAPEQASPAPALSSLLVELEGRLDAQRRNLDTLLQRYTETHPDVLGAQRIIRDLEAQRARLVAQLGGRPMAAAQPQAPTFSGPRASEQLRISLTQSEALVAALTARVAEYSQRHASLRASASLVPKLEAELAQLNRDYDVNKRNYETLVARRESANLSGEMQSVSGVADFRLVDPPRVSPGPVFPSRRILYPLALLLALGIGVGVTYVARELRPAFYDARSLREATGLPLLGVVSLTLRPADMSNRRRSLALFAGGTGGLVAVYALGFLMLEVFLKQAPA